MIQDARAEAPIASGNGGETPYENWLFHDREALENRYGMEFDRVRELMDSDEGRRQLLQHMQETDPSLNGNVEGALDQVNLNMEQLQKKEGFLRRMVKLPGRAVKSLLSTMKKHPVLTSLTGIALLIALLYFTPALAPTAGEYGKRLIESFKGVLTKVGIETPEVAVDAIANTPVIGGSVPMDVVEKGAEIAQDPEAMEELGRVIRGITE